tara:strand:- start:6269 stop:7006 length:738 start_codon:yes stop_codon:yes gene_type:complete
LKNDNLKKNNIVIFGGSGLIGSTISNELFKNNNIINFDLKKNANVPTVIIKKINSNTIKYCLNYAKKKLKKIDVLIVCIYPKKYLPYNMETSKVKAKDYLNDIENHFGSFLEINLQFLNYFRKIKSGNIINFSSIYGSYNPRFEIYKNIKMNVPFSYAISKNSIISMSKFFAKEYLKDNLKINTISPGGVFNKQNPTFLRRYLKFCRNKKMMGPDKIIPVVKMLVSKKSDFITGQDFIIDDGFTL